MLKGKWFRLGLLALSLCVAARFAAAAETDAPKADAPAVEAAAVDAGGVAATPAVAESKSDTLAKQAWYIAPVASLIGLLFALVFYGTMMKSPDGNERMREIAQAVREGAYAYLYAQYRTVGKVFLVLVVIFLALAYKGIQNPFVPVAFLTGGFFSGLCGFLGMRTATNASSRTAQGASESLNRGLQVAFRSGAVMGLIVVGFGLIDICLWYWVLDQYVYTTDHMLNGFVKLFGDGDSAIWLVRPGTMIDQKYAEITTTMLTFGMGASTQALFARVGGGIYTKAADVGADLVGKVEAGIPEDDPRNPATIADNVGDNVGDVAGMGADLYESYCGAILSTAALGAAIMQLPKPGTTEAFGISAVIAPMIVAGIGTILSILGVYLVKCEEKASMLTLLKALRFGVNTSAFLILAAVAALAYLNIITWGIFGSVVAGLAAGIIIGLSTEYYTSDEYAPTKGISEQCQTGPATCIIAGLGVGMLSSAIPVITTVIGILAAFGFAGGFSESPNAMAYGLYGIGFAAVGMLATLGITLATDAYGPIADNAGGNAEMSHLGPHVRERTDNLDMLGNTTAATGKGFAIGSAALTAMALLAAYIEEIRIWIKKIALQTGHNGFYDQGSIRFYVESTYAGPKQADQIAGGNITDVVSITKAQIAHFAQAYDITLMNPKVLCGLFLGGMMVLVICALTMRAVGRAARSMVEEVRRQFREIAGIMEGTGKPDYARCVEISTKGAQREMVIPSLAAIAVPVVVGILLGVPGVMGLLAGSLAAGFSIACLLNNAGGAWDNAKKHIEKGNFGGKYLQNAQGQYVDASGKVVAEKSLSKNATHGAAVIGDTVGDPCKDTSGPSLNILLKLMSMVSVVFAGVIVMHGDSVIPAIMALFK